MNSLVTWPLNHPKEWGFGAGVEGNNQITGATVTYPGSPGPVVLPEDEGSYDLDNQGFTSQAFLDNDYPNGNVTLSITENSITTPYGPFSITGDAYPNTPHILNAVALQSHDFSQNFTLMWNSFTGPDANDAQLINISTRGIAGTGDGLMIAGVIVKGTGNRTLYIRGNGPLLPDSLQGRLTNTTLEMRDATDNVIGVSDNWQDNENFASIVATNIPPGFPEEAALLVYIPASASREAYTIALRGANEEEGLAIIEIFEVPD